MNIAESLFGRTDEIRATLRIDGQSDNALVVLSFKGVEKISKNFVYKIVVGHSAETAAGLDDALGRDVLLTLGRASDESATYFVHGMVQEVHPSGVATGKNQRQSVLRIVPRLQELCHKQRCQVFQNVTVVDIAKELFEPWQIEVTARLSPEPLKRDYCTQVNERDFDFLLRILSEEGIHFHFEQDDKKATVVLVNDPRGYQPIAGKQAIAYRDAGGALTTDHIRTLVRERRVRPGSVAYRDYNFLRPTRAMLASNESTPEGMGTLVAREVYEYPGHYNDPDGESVGVGEDVQGSTRSGKARAKLRLEEQRADAFTFSGTTNCLRVQVGKVFEINDHSDKSFNRKYVITRVELRGEGADAPALEQGATSSGTGVSVKFWAVSAESPIRPKVRPKPPAHLRTARVVGPNEDQPYVDQYGRIKIQFAWDREGPLNDKSSCWVRMMTPVAHHNQGAYTAHRVGAEVLVDFLDGDVDRPMVIGSVFNEDNRQPQTLPDDATRAVLYRGLSVPGNSGNNEISCEDKAGQEEIFVHAQKDLNERILNNHDEKIGTNQTSTVGANQTITVGANETITVGANQTVTVGANQTVTVGANRTVSVTGNETITVTQKRTETVNNSESVTIKNGRDHTISTADDKLTVSVGNRLVDIKTDHNIHSKTRVEKVDETIDVLAGTSISIHRQGNATLDLTDNKAKLWTPKASATINDGTITLEAADKIEFKCGATNITLTSDGHIDVTGSTQIKLACNSSVLTLEPSTAILNGSNVNATASGEMNLSGALIKIN
ncbi:MAG: type VI secretion system tip protein VgrG [Polyangiaceae bacterium]|nr:type VI secretion system tip protein VgrG [Polyangiaceae bacterium]